MRTPAQLSFVLSTAIASVAALSGAARAHFDLIDPKPADTSTDGGKGAAPCGPTAASGVINKDQDGKPLQGGHQVRISISETLMHPGHYRIALAQSRAELPADPEVQSKNGQSVSATIKSPAVFPVLADGLFAHTSGNAPLSFTMNLTLPNIKCTKCTLQVIEFMAQHGAPYFYHHCADLQFDPDPALGTDGGAPDAGGGADAGTGGGNGSAGSSGSTGGQVGSGGAGTGTGGADSGSGGSTGSGGAVNVSTGGSGTSSGSGGTTAGSGGSSASGGSNGGKDAGSAGNSGSGGGGGCAIARQSPGTASALLVLTALGLSLLRRRRGR